MSEQIRPVQTRVEVCDLCGEILPKGEPGERGSLTAGFIAHRVTPSTKRAWLHWPPAGRERRMSWEDKRKPENRTRTYDFHADCILKLVEGAVTTRATPNQEDTK